MAWMSRVAALLLALSGARLPHRHGRRKRDAGLPQAHLRLRTLDDVRKLDGILLPCEFYSDEYLARGLARMKQAGTFARLQKQWLHR